VVGGVMEEVKGVLLLKENNALTGIESITWWMNVTQSIDILLGTKSKIFLETITIMIREVNRNFNTKISSSFNKDFPESVSNEDSKQDGNHFTP